MKLKKNYILLMLLCVATLGITSCSKDDDEAEMTEPTGSLTVANQTLENNMLTISNVNMSEDGWVVIHRDNGSGGPMVPDIISKPKMVMAGTSSDVMIELKDGVEIQDGETLWVMLHTDDGEIGTYEFDGSNGLDAPIMNGDNIVTKSFMVNVAAPTGSLMADSQMVMDNKIIVSSITLDQGGFVVIHADTGDGAPMVPEIISEPLYLDAGTHTDVEVTLKEDANVHAGDMVWVMLHTDNGTAEEYEFDGENGLDGPIIVDGNIVMSSIAITGVQDGDVYGTLMVEDQALTNNTVTVKSISLDQDGWVVIHADTGSDAPVVPAIISEPVYLKAGTYNNVEVPLKETANISMNDKVWVMLHTDTGVEGTYEFDGSNGLDGPIVVDGNIVMSQLTLTDVTTEAITGSLEVSDQAVSDNMITVSSITLAHDGWVVIHADTGSGAPVVPDIISEPVYLEAGTTTDVKVSFKESADVKTGDTLWVMLHNDTGAKGVYEFDGMNGLDLPIVVDGNIALKSITVTE